MSSTDRQNRLLVAEDWRRIYQSFKNADFQSYDFENLRRVMIDYLRENYPEDFNDYIESSEYLALIDMIAFLGQSIAFRVDLNARENFLELAERRESVLRLARTLSYNAKRNKAANGLLKWKGISTTQSILDGNGRNLSGQEILWNDPANVDWEDQFKRIINAALPITAQLGNPESKAEVYNIPTEQYRFQTLGNSIPVFAFSKGVDGRTMNFEVVSTIIKDGQDITEDPPLAGKPLSFIYRNDGKGAASNANGYFLHFRQGSLNTGTFTIAQPGTNEIIDIDAANINDTDVWLYKLDTRGVESEYWMQVPSFEANNVIYNSLKKNIRNIYSVVTRANDRVSLAFSDGTFGTVPLGTFRVYYRTSNGLTYTINPKDMRNINIDVPYISNSGQIESLSITMTLQSSVSNSSASESNEDIKTKAPSTYYTQNRMITAEDYNLSPLSVDQDVIKVKATNRSSSGISRYFDLIDPTGKYSNINLFADDGVLYKEEYEESFRFSYTDRTDIEGVIYNQVLPFIKEKNIRNFYYNKFNRVNITTDLNYRWTQKTKASNLCTGYLIDNSNSIIGYDTTTVLRYMEVGCLLKFTAPTNRYFIVNKENELEITSDITPYSTKYVWAKVVSITDNGTVEELDTGEGSVALNVPIPSLAILTQIIPRWRTSLDASTISTMINLIYNTKTFGLRYDVETKVWRIINDGNLNKTSGFSLGKSGDNTNQNLDSSWLLIFDTDNEYYTVKARKLRYIFESDKQLRFYFDSKNRIYDTRSNDLIKDKIKILNINNKPNAIKSFTFDLDWEIISEFIGTDGYVDNKKIELSFNDSNNDDIVDDPDLFDIIVAPITTNDAIDTDKYIILERYETVTGQLDYRYITNSDQKVLVKLNIDTVQSNEKTHNQHFYFIDNDVVMRWDNSEGRFISSLNYRCYQGRSDLKYQYVHYADYETRIDPGQINIIDLYVLVKQYDLEFRRWLLGATDTEPLAPSSDQLALMLSNSLNSIKAMSDEVIYHPVRYKVLFGARADPTLRAVFKIIKNNEQIISDNEIKSRVLSAINQFFSLENWDFGDTFYFSELVAFVMNSTAPYLSNIVIVPRQDSLSFGSLFEIRSENDQIFINGATTDDIEIISSITASALISQGAITSQSSVVSQQAMVSRLGSV